MKLNQLSKLVVAIVTMDYMMEVQKSDDSRLELSDVGEARFLKELIAALGFDYELRFPDDGEYGRLMSNGSWTGLVGMVQRGEADMACSGLMMTEQRSKVVDFSTSYRGTALSFAIGKPGELHSRNAYLYPFKPKVWGFFFGIIIAVSTVLYMDGNHSFVRIVFDLIGSILGQQVHLVGTSRRPIWILWWGYAIVISSCYSGCLLSFLTLPFKQKGVETFQELASAVTKGTHRCYVQRGTNTASYLRNTGQDHLQVLGKAIEDNGWYYNTSEIAKNKGVLGDSAEITYEVELRFFYGSQLSKVFISSDTISAVSIGIVISPNFCCKKKLDKFISRFTNSGLVEKYIGDAAFQYQISVRDTNRSAVRKNRKVSLEGMSGAFILLFFGYAISSVTFMGELLISKY